MYSTGNSTQYCVLAYIWEKNLKRMGTTDRFQTRKGVRQGCILSPCLFNLYAQYIMWNKSQAGWSTSWNQIAERNINHLRYADDTTLMAESEEELKSLLMKVKESEKVGLKLSIQKTKIMVSGPITSWEIGKQWKQCQILFCIIYPHPTKLLFMWLSF